MTDTLRNLKNKRAGAKCQLSRIENYLKDLTGSEEAYILKVKLDSLLVHYNKYQTHHQEIVGLAATPDEVESDSGLSENVIDDRFELAIAQLNSLIDKADQNKLRPSDNSNVVLPKINIKPFSGIASEWTSFFDLFTALVLNNSKLQSNSEKLYYLKSLLRGQPLELIDSLSVTNQNLSVAIEILSKTYDDQSKLLFTLFSNLLEQKPLSKCNAGSLKDFYISSKKNLELIKNMSLTSEQYFDSLIVFLLEQKLDFNSKRAFESERDNTNLATVDSFFDFLNKRLTVLENLNLFEPNGQKKDLKHTETKSKVSLHSSVGDRQRPSSSSPQAIRTKCVYCSDSSHSIYRCQKFLALSPSDRHKFAKSSKLCLNCLNPLHLLPACKSLHKCLSCGKSHHSLLHFETNSNSSFPNNQTNVHPNRTLLTSNNSNSNLPTIDVPQASLAATSFFNKMVILPTALVNVHCSDGRVVAARLLLDSASQMSIIKKSFADNLGIPYRSHKLNISGLGNNKCTHSTNVIDIKIVSQVDSSRVFHVTCSVIDNITGNLPQFTISPHRFNLPDHVKLDLADPLFFQPNEIQILIGADLYFNLLKGEVLSLGANLPTFVNTHLGYVVAGPVPENRMIHSPKSSCVLSFLSVANDHFSEPPAISALIEKFWEIEDISSSNIIPEDDQIVDQIFAKTTKILPSGRYQVDMPFNPNSSKKLGHSLSIARRRFSALESKFTNNLEFFETYKNVLFNYLSLGHARIIPLSLHRANADEIKYYVPHRAVVRESSVSSKCRIVFDYSCPSDNGVSLNDLTLKGYQVQDNLFDILCRFRTFRYVLCADIQMMYRMIEINPNQRHLQNVLWRDSPSDPFKCIELSRLSFGQNCSPFLATSVLKNIAMNNPSFPLARDAILFQTYMDDILGGVDNFSHLETLYSELNSMLNKHNFFLHKWHTNSSSFSKSLSLDLAPDLDLNLENSSSKILGLKWSSTEDTLQICPSPLPKISCLTKRIVLSIIASTFDPLGLVNPLIVLGKLIMQSLWELKLDWDTPIIDATILKQWQTFSSILADLGQSTIPRLLVQKKEILKVSLHGFCDASQSAYGCCVYLVATYTDGSISSQLIAAKSRVSPLKSQLTIPKLELCAMVLLALLLHKLVAIFSNSYKFDSLNLWSDSLVSLSWIKRKENDLSPFVARRVNIIHEHTVGSIWRHIRSELNPADILTRGKFPAKVRNFWFHGPTLLCQTQDFDSIDTFAPLDSLPELKKVSLTTTHVPSNPLKELFHCSKFSKLQRTLAYVLRFLNNCKKNTNKLSGPLSVDELRHSLNFILVKVQKENFHKELQCLSNKQIITDKSLLPLNLFLDDDRVLRVGGRLQNADINYEKKFPILLPQRDSIVDSLIFHEHCRLGHTGPQNVLGNLRQRYWPLGGIRAIKKVLSKCITCYRFHAQFSSQLMAPLPIDRIQPDRAFNKVGVDFAGPIFLKSSRLRKAPLLKAYISLFICMVTKAVHIELVTSLSTEAFLATLKRFIGRRGNPSVIYSDNGTNFVGTRNQLRDLATFFQSHKNVDSISSYLAQTDIVWKFIPARSPHWGGLWEAAVRSAKTHLTRLVGTSNFTYEETSTILVQIEAVLNSRPLYPLSNDPNDCQPLTPGHFLIGCPLTSFPEKDLRETPCNRLNFWAQCTKIQQTFWKRWSTDYLHQLQHRPKWQKITKPLSVGDLVLVLSEDRPPLNWPLARIVELFPGRDGKVRVAKIRTSEGEYTRPIVKLAPLPLKDE